MLLRCPKCGVVVYEGDLHPIDDGDEYECECGAALIYRTHRESWFEVPEEVPEDA